MSTPARSKPHQISEDGQEVKYCFKCDTWKVLELFNKQSKRWDKLNPACRDCANASNRKWYDANAQHKLEYNAAWSAANKDIRAKHYTDWRKSNPDKVRLKAAKRRGRENFGMSEQDWIDTRKHVTAIKDDTCFYCDKLGIMHIEHLTPLDRGGTNHWWNLQMSCQSCNLTKGTKTAEEFIQADSIACELMEVM